MLGYIISDKEKINVEEHEIEEHENVSLNFFVEKDLKTFIVEDYEIFSFYVLHKTDLNIFVVENNKVLYKNSIVFNACFKGHVKVLEWFKNLNVKKVIKWSSKHKFIKTIKYKTKNNYIKGYNKN